MSATKREVLSPVIDDELIEQLMAQVDAGGVELLGPDGVLTDLTKRIMERALDVERSEHLGYERGDRAGIGSGEPVDDALVACDLVVARPGTAPNSGVNACR